MIKKSVLPCGLTILSETRAELPSLAISYTIASGSRDETPKQAGLHHLIEHMVFKGNPKYSQKQIAEKSDQMGGHLNAFTSKEITQYYTKAIPEHQTAVFDLLSHLVFSPHFNRAEFKKEKEVVIQEIRETRDTPDTYLFDLFYLRIYPDSSLGAPITGDEDTLASFTHDELTTFYQARYQPSRAILTVVGKLDHALLVEQAEQFFKQYPCSPPLPLAPPPCPNFQSGRHALAQDSLEQIYHVVGMPAPAAAHPLRAPYMLVNELLGGGMSSRLHQKIREELGLAYTVSSFYENYLDCGAQMIFAITHPNHLHAYESALHEELALMHRSFPTSQEIERVRDHLKASTILGLESNVDRLRLITNQWLYLGKFQSLEEMAAEINAINDDDIAKVLDQFFLTEHLAQVCYGHLQPITAI